MSLINDMLKDLESRENNTRHVPYIGLAPNSIQEAPVSFNKKLLTVGLGLTLAAIIGTIVFVHKHASTSTREATSTNVANSETPPNANDTTNANWLHPISISGITLQVKENITEITLLLDHPALYHLTTDDVQNQLSFIVENAQLQSELPPINYLNTAIQSITTKKINSDMQFNLLLASGATVKYVNLNSPDKNPELVIGIENVGNPTAGATGDTHKPIKTQVADSLLAQQYQAALAMAENGNYESAIMSLSALLKVGPEYKDARVSLAALMMDQNRSLEATKLIDDGLKLNPNFTPFIELKARALTTTGNIQEALTLLQSNMPPLADNPEYHAFLAALYERSNNNQMAINLYRQLLNINPKNGSWWLGLGVSLEKMNHRKEALDAYTKALSSGFLNSQSVAYLQTRLHALQEGAHESE